MDIAPRALSDLPEIVFEPDRFELTDGRLELSGRWYGVHGRRFIRPTLIFRREDDESRLLADLEHKPWAAENGEWWHAAFPCNGDLNGAAAAELTVAPDVTVELPIPEGLGARRDADNGDADTRRRAAERADDAEAVEPEEDTESTQNGTPPTTEGTAPVRSVTQARDQAEQTQALSAAQAEIATLRERLDQAAGELERERTRFERELGEAQEATADAAHRRDEAIAVSRKAIDARRMAENTIEQALAARGKAKETGEQALAQHQEALAQLEEAIGQRDRALTERDQALMQRDPALTERDEASAQLGEALTQRDQAVSDLERVGAERDELADAYEQLQTKYQNVVTTRGSAAVMRNAAIESTAQRRHAQWLGVAIAVTALLVVTLAVALILGSN